MKIYFDGCSHTWGSELDNNIQSRYSNLVCNHFGAEEYNIAERGGSDHRLTRNLLEHDLSQYDMFVIQMTYKRRNEYFYDGGWKKTNWNIIFDKVDFKLHNGHNITYKHPPSEVKEVWYGYYTKLHSDVLADSNQLIYYNVIKGLIEHKPHAIIGIDNSDKLPLDFSYQKNNLPRRGGGHPSEKGHKIIANDVISLLTKHK
jgi:hypothetical protein|tara:strand:+ start:429 stop:1031 length:603 start_codon:yes stop_codon:yes gene_type:complete